MMNYTNSSTSPITINNSFDMESLGSQTVSKKARISDVFPVKTTFKLEQYDEYNSSSNHSLLGGSSPDIEVGHYNSNSLNNGLTAVSNNTFQVVTNQPNFQIDHPNQDDLKAFCNDNNNSHSLPSASTNSLFNHPSVSSTTKNCVKPSESMFVRLLAQRCKRLAPLWFRGVSSMREKNREENRRATTNSSQSHSNWTAIAEKIAEMSPSCETDAVSNLLKKLYKELPAEMVLWFVKCWLSFPETLHDDSCVLSRGDAKARMRRIDGGKGSDKVWRLDTIVGMLYHGMPMSSTDTNIMIHTCEQELCVRPQHLRFRASSVALVVVLKALQQAGYQILPPTKQHLSSSDVKRSSDSCDESVDISGPFSIEELQRYRSEEVSTCSQSIGKYVLNSSDTEILEVCPLLKEYLPLSLDDQPTSNSSRKHHSRVSSFTTNNEVQLNSSSSQQSSTLSQDLNKIVSNTAEHYLPHENNQLGQSQRRGIKRSLTPSCEQISCDGGSHSFSPPPHLTCQVPPSVARPSAFSQPSSHPGAPLPPPVASVANITQRYSPALHMLQSQQPLRFSPAILQQATGGSSQSSSSPPIIGPSGSGKNTPRQPAKKRLEARTPTCELDATVDEDISSEFVVHNTTPFTPVNRQSGDDNSLPPTLIPQTLSCLESIIVKSRNLNSPNPNGQISSKTSSQTSKSNPSSNAPSDVLHSSSSIDSPIVVSASSSAHPIVGDYERELQEILGPKITAATVINTVRPTPLRAASISSTVSSNATTESEAAYQAAQLLMRAYQTSPNTDVIELVGSLMSKYGVSLPRPGSSAAQQIYYNFRNASTSSPMHLRHLSFTPLSVDSEHAHSSLEAGLHGGRASTNILRTPDFITPVVPSANNSTNGPSNTTAQFLNSVCK